MCSKNHEIEGKSERGGVLEDLTIFKDKLLDRKSRLPFPESVDDWGKEKGTPAEDSRKYEEERG